MKKIFLVILLSFFAKNYYGQVTTAINPTIAQMQAILQGNGVTITGLNITCPAGAYASFNNGAAALGGLNSGILLTTGTASNVAGTTSGNLSFSNGTSGSPLGNSLSGATTFDACFINFLITPNCSTLSISYVFASEEYPEFVGTGVNDVFGFVISGPNPSGPAYINRNIAIVPGTANTAVSIDNVNATTNSAYFEANPVGLQYDGRTTVLTASTVVIPCQTYTMTIGVWDDGDRFVDSGVFLDVNGLSCVGNPTITAVANPASICGAQTITLTAGGGIASGTYTWVAPASGGLVSTNGQTVTANPTAATTYTVLYSDINTCPGVPLVKTTTLTFTPPPNLPISQSPAGSICAGQSVTLTANGGTGTYSWSPSVGLSTTTNSLTVATPTTTKTYTVTKTVGSCVSTTVVTVNVNALSTVTITPAFSTICSGQSVVLNASGAGPFVWAASSGANPASVATVTVTPATTTTYTVLTGSGTCTASAVATVSIATAPAITITPSLTTICSVQTVTLSASGSAPFVWTASSGANPASAATVTVSPSTTTTYSVLSGSGSCTATAVAMVSVTLPTPISITPSLSTICVGQSVTLISTGSAPFAWSSSTGAIAANAATVTVSPNTTSTYTVVSGAGSCTTSAVAIVSIAVPSPITITPSNTTICSSQNVTLATTGFGPFTWVASNGVNPPNSVSVVVSPTSTTTYSVLSGTGSCTVAAIATVSVITINPSINANSTYYCQGVAPVIFIASGANTYTWSGNNLSSPTGTITTASPTAPSIYTLTSQSGNCILTNTVSISVPAVTSITVTTTNTLICPGNSATLTASGANTYTWMPTSTIAPTIVVTPTVQTTYNVVGTTLAGCFTLPANVTVTVTPLNTPTLVATSSITCSGGTATITALPLNPLLSYTWSPTSAIMGANNTSIIEALPTSTAAVTYTLFVSNGACVATATTQIIAMVAPIGNFITLNNDTICKGINGCVTFSSTTSGSLPLTYAWYYESGIGTSTVGAYPEACYPSAGSFSVEMIVSNYCGTDTVVKNNFVTVFDYPVITVRGDTTINIGETAQIYASGGLNYQWSPNVNGSIACLTCSNTIVQPTVTTQYIVVVSNSIYCKIQDTVTVKVDINCGDFFVPNVFSPNGDGLNDNINVHGRCILTYNLQIYNRWGEKVFETNSVDNSWDGSFRGQKMDTGVFIYKADGVSIDGQSFKFKGNITLIR